MTIFFSFKYSERVYIYFLKTYYNSKYSEVELVNKAKEMYDKKQFALLEKFINPLIIIYPDNDELKELTAYNYFKLGKPLKSAELLADIINKGVAESRTLEEILKALFDSGNYNELVYFYDKKIMRYNINTAYYYGVALYNKGKYDESYQSLMYAKNSPFKLPDVYYYIGLNLDKKGKTAEAISFIKEAYESDRHNQAYKKALIMSYNKLKLFRDAEILLRSR